MKLLNKLICLCGGHKWKYYSSRTTARPRLLITYKCVRCGKTKEVIEV